MPYETQPDYVEFVYDNGGRTTDRYVIQWAEGDTYGHGYASPNPYWRTRMHPIAYVPQDESEPVDATAAEAMCFVDGGCLWRGGSICVRCAARLRCSCGRFVRADDFDRHFIESCPWAKRISDAS